MINIACLNFNFFAFMKLDGVSIIHYNFSDKPDRAC